MNVPRALVRWSLALVVVGIVGGIVCLTALVERIKAIWASRVRLQRPFRRAGISAGPLHAGVREMRGRDAGLEMDAAHRARLSGVDELQIEDYAAYAEGGSLRR